MNAEKINQQIDQIFQETFSEIGSGVRSEQRRVIQSVLAGHNTLALMPTGGGKSLCFWIAGLALGGTTLTVFPLTALMDEQALKLRSHGLSVLVLHSGVPAQKQYQELIALAQGQLPDFIFVSPERLATDGFLEHVLRRQREAIKLVVIDEIHCVSQWGHDFRPFYREIPNFLDQIFGSQEQWPRLLGITATLSQKDINQACLDFHIPSQNILKSPYLLRYAIDLQVEKVEEEDEKDEKFWSHLAQHRQEKVLIYLDNRSTGPRSTEGMCAHAKSLGYSAAYFHAGMTSEAKAEVIRQFKEGAVRFVFATSAFGMGIDIPDIRGVIHYRPPESVEQYYQQIGRVGRDGKAAWAMLYYSDKNVSIRKSHFIDRSFPTPEQVKDVFSKLTAGRGTLKTFAYFEEETAQTVFHYLLGARALSRQGKGVRDITVFKSAPSVNLPRLAEYKSASRTGNIIMVANRLSMPPIEILQDFYQWLAAGQLRMDGSPQKCLIIEQLTEQLADETLNAIAADVEEKRLYRYQLFDQLVEMLEGYTHSINLHQAIGRYLGVDKFQMARIHETVSGVWVRSKSEVIVANLLTEHGIPFSYEERLKAGGVGFIPDFTIHSGDKTYYWEHLGMLDLAQYRQNWEVKRAWYEEHFPGQLITTQESAVLSQTVLRLIQERFGSVSTEIMSTVAGAAVHASPTADDPSELVEAAVPASPSLQATIWTEGQTDWKHMKAALRRFQNQWHYPHLVLSFQEDEDDMGDRELLTLCRTYSRSPQTPPVLCIFDRDVPQTLRQVVEGEQGYKNWGNNVFSVALPVPTHREQTPEICIEFYYQDVEIKTKDEQGRRLFLGTEFNSRTLRHLTDDLVLADQNKAGRFTIVDDRVNAGPVENVAMAKSAFAQNVLEAKPRFDSFDISAFVVLFDLIEQILSSCPASHVPAVRQESANLVSSETPLAQPPATQNQRRWDEASFLEDMRRTQSEEYAQVALRIVEWARPKVKRFSWGTGELHSGCVPIVSHKGVEHKLFSVRSQSGTLQVYFRHYQAPFDTETMRVQLVNRLNEIDGISIAPDAISLQPSVELEVLKSPTTLHRFFSVFDWMIEQIRAS